MLLFRFGLLLFLVVLMHLVCSLWHFTFPYWVVLPLNSLAVLSFAGYAMRLMGMSFLHVRDEEVYQYLCQVRSSRFKVAMFHLVFHALAPQMVYLFCLATGQFRFPVGSWFTLDVAASTVGLSLYMQYYVFCSIIELGYVRDYLKQAIEEDQHMERL